MGLARRKKFRSLINGLGMTELGHTCLPVEVSNHLIVPEDKGADASFLHSRVVGTLLYTTNTSPRQIALVSSTLA